MDDFNNDSDYMPSRMQYVLAEKPSLGLLIKTEPSLGQLFRMAAQMEDRRNRWQCYELLKTVGTELYVGYSARHALLRNSESYSLFLEALDLLLPPPEVEGEDVIDWRWRHEIALLRDAVTRLFPSVKLPEIKEDDQIEDDDHQAEY